jgi:hypothetical protein
MVQRITSFMYLKPKIFAVCFMALSSLPILASAKVVDLTCKVLFALENGPDHIFEFHLDLYQKTNVFWYRGHSYEVIYKFWADDMSVTNTEVLLSGGMEADAQLSKIVINRTTLGFYAETAGSPPVPAAGSCELGRKKLKF